MIIKVGRLEPLGPIGVYAYEHAGIDMERNYVIVTLCIANLLEFS